MPFIQKKIIFTIFLAIAVFQCFSQSFVYNETSPRQKYAVGKLREALKQDKFSSSFKISLKTDSTGYAFETYSISKNGNDILLQVVAKGRLSTQLFP
jgi:hypothetical protein